MHMRQLLHDPALVSITLIGGRQGLDRQVNAVGLIEAPDIEEYLVPAQLLLTTGYHYYQDVDKLTHLIQTMAARGCAGLGIKADRYFKHIPQDVIAVADEVGLPLVVTPANSYLSEVVKTLTEIVIGSDALVLSATIEQNQQLSALAMANANYSTVLDAVYTWFHHDIVLLDSHFVIRHHSAGLASQLSGLASGIRDAGVDYQHLDHQLTITCMDRRITLLPLMVMYPENKAFIGLFDLDTPTPVEQLQLQQIQNVLSLMNSRTDVANESAAHMENNFFTNMLNGTLSPELLRQRLQDYALRFDQKGYCAVIQLVPKSVATLVSMRQVEGVRRLVNWFIAEYALPVVAFVIDLQVVLVIQEPQRPEHFLQVLLHFLTHNIESKFQVKIGYSRSCLPLASLTNTYQEAKEAVSLTQVGDTLAQFRPKDVNELLHLIPHTEAQSFITEMLAPLLNLDNAVERQELMRTLRLYLFHHQQINAVAKELFIHRNTVSYRLQKIQQLLGVDLQDPTLCERLNLALLLAK